MIEYRREVDGLRAVAVFPVLLFHAGFDAFSGGYVGVDVFFVISGYLITSIILSDMGGEGFSITRFYERRARRILPALVFVVLCTLPFSYFYMLPEQTVNFGQSVVSVALFFSNFQFWAEAGYFGASAEEMPLLHSWSLSVEEQFYLVFPLVLLVVNRYAKQYLFPLVLLALVVSLAVTEYALGFAASAAYFWSPFRAWELLIGVLLALHMTKAGRPSEGVLTELGGLLGLAMIGYSVVAFDSETPFPGVWALLPTLGTGLVLYCASGNNWAGRVLSIGPVVGLGLISYSVYLWHQPLYAFARLMIEGHPSLWVMGALVPVAFVCGYLSWRYVEKPFRDSRRISQAQIFKFSGVSLAGLVIAGVLFQLDDGLRFRFSPADNKVMTESQYSPFAEKCEASASRTVTPEEACTYFGDHKHYAVLGDSHVTALAYIFAETLKPQNEGLYHFAHSWGVPGFTMPEYERRHKWSVDALAFLQEQDDVHTVILAYRHSYYLNGENNGFYPHLPDESPLPKLGGGQEEVQERYWGSFSYAVEQLLAAGKRVVVLLPVPELGRPLEDAVYNSAWRGQKKAGIPYAYYRERNEKFYTLLDQAPWRDKVVLVDPTKQLCDDDNCYIVEDGQSLYGDDDHLSLFGARFLVDELMRKLGETQK